MLMPSIRSNNSADLARGGSQFMLRLRLTLDHIEILQARIRY